MYFWDLEKLKHDLYKNKLPESEILKYFLAHTFVLGMAMIPVYTPNHYDVFCAILVIPITVTGIYNVYLSNGGCFGREFMAKYFSISWVVFIRSIIVVVCIGLILGYMGALSSEGRDQGTSILEVAAITIISIVYFWRVSVHVSDIARQEMIQDVLGD